MGQMQPYWGAELGIFDKFANWLTVQYRTGSGPTDFVVPAPRTVDRVFYVSARFVGGVLKEEGVWTADMPRRVAGWYLEVQPVPTPTSWQRGGEAIAYNANDTRAPGFNNPALGVRGISQPPGPIETQLMQVMLSAAGHWNGSAPGDQPLDGIRVRMWADPGAAIADWELEVNQFPIAQLPPAPDPGPDPGPGPGDPGLCPLRPPWPYDDASIALASLGAGAMRFRSLRRS